MRKIGEALKLLAQQGDVHVLAHDEDGGAVHVTDFTVVFSWGQGWDHVSVSRPDRCPTWDEMEMVKRAFFKDRETAMQLHVPPEDHINCHPRCLHLWRPQRVKIPRPPSIMVAPAAVPVAIQRIIDEVKVDKDKPFGGYNRTYHRHNR